MNFIAREKGQTPVTIFRHTIPFFHDETTIRRIQIRQDTPNDKTTWSGERKMFVKFQKD